MSESEVQDPVVEPVVKEEVSPLAEETSPKPDQVETPEVVEEEHKTIPKERFDQVWARTKKAEAKAEAIQAELQREREERIRLEERAKVQQETVQSQKEYTWAELENFISEGKLTRDQAQEYKDTQTEKRLRQKLDADQAKKSTDGQILGRIEEYKKLIPDVMEFGSESRTRYEAEYQHFVRNLGYPENYATQEAAIRSAFGPIEKVKRTSQAKTVITNKEPFVETHTPQSSRSVVKSFKDTLPEYKVKHYEKMMKAGLVKDWKGAEELEKWTPKVVGGGR